MAKQSHLIPIAYAMDRYIIITNIDIFFKSNSIKLVNWIKKLTFFFIANILGTL